MYTSESKESILQKAYREFFKKKLEAYKVTSPSALPKEIKSKFFTEVKAEWKKAKKLVQGPGKSHSGDYDFDFEDDYESMSSVEIWDSLSAKTKQSFLQKEYRKYFVALLQKTHKVLSPAKLAKADKTTFFNTIKAEWPKFKKLLLKTAPKHVLAKLKEQEDKAAKVKHRAPKMATASDDYDFESESAHTAAQRAAKHKSHTMQHKIHANMVKSFHKLADHEASKGNHETAAAYHKSAKHHLHQANRHFRAMDRSR